MLSASLKYKNERGLENARCLLFLIYLSKQTSLIVDLRGKNVIAVPWFGVGVCGQWHECYQWKNLPSRAVLLSLVLAYQSVLSNVACFITDFFFLSFIHLNSLHSNFTLIWVATLLQLEVLSEYPWIFYLHTQEPLLRMLHFHLRGLLKWSTANTHISIPKGQLVQIRVNYFSSSLSVGCFINCYLYVFWTHPFFSIRTQ